MTDFAYLTIAEASALIRDRKISPVEYAQALLARIDKLDPKLNAFLRQTPDIAMADARRAEEEIGKGDWKGPLHGVPYGLKDIIDYEGLPTTGHSKILIDNIAKADAPVAAKLRAAGGVLLGKMSTHEFAIGGPCFDLPWPPARNPWNPGHHPGGSSSGSGSALASGLMPAALGTDTGGSVRNPASCCGIVGMKATYGRTSRRGVLPLSFSLDHVGPMTRTVEDNAILLNIIAGYDAGDPGSAAVDAPDFTADLGKGVKGMKIGVIRHFYTRDEEADPEMAKSIEDALKVLQGARRDGAGDRDRHAPDLRRVQPHHPQRRGLRHSREVAAGTARGLRRPDARAAALRRLPERRGLRQRDPAAAHPGRPLPRGDRRPRRRRHGQQHGARLPDRRRRDGRPHLWPPGPRAV